MNERKKDIFVLIFLLLASFIITLLMTNAQIMVFFGPNASGTNLSLGNGTNWSTTILLNVTFVNGTDIMITNNVSGTNSASSINATFWYNQTFGQGAGGNLTILNRSTTCGAVNSTNSVFACWTNLTITGFADGLYNITATLSNASGGATTNATAINSTFVSNIRFDSTVPQAAAANFSSPVIGGNYSNKLTGFLVLNITAFDAGIGVQAVLFNITNASGTQNATATATNPTGNIWNTTFNTSSVPDGLYNVTAFVNDTLNNLNSTAVITTVRFDNTVPQVAAANISSNTSTGGNYSNRQTGLLILNVSVFDAGVGTQAVFFNITNASGTQNASIIAGNLAGNAWNATFNTSSVPDGLYNITVFANDTVGNLNSTAAVTTIRFDNTVPQVAAANISSNTVTGGNYSSNAKGLIILNVSVFDAGVGTNAVFFNITNASGTQNATITATNPTGNVWNATFNTSSVPDGLYNITIFANDTVNNLNSTAAVTTIRVDSSIPSTNASAFATGVNTISLLAGGNYSDFNAGLLNLNISVTDTGTGVSVVFFNITNASGTQNATYTAARQGTTAWYNATINVTNFPDGQYNITAFANDSAGNLNSTGALTRITFDNSAPGLTFSCSPASVPSGTNTNCTCTATDSQSGLNSTYNTSTTNLGTSYTANPSVTNTGTFTTTCTGKNAVALTSNLDATYTVTVVSVSGSSSSSASASGGGGGGGTSTSPSAKSSNIIDVISAGSSQVTKINDASLGIKQIEISVNNDVKNVEISVSKYDSRPAAVTVEKTGKVYKYLDIKATNIANNLKKATITIQVEKSWFSSNNLDKNNVALFHFEKNQWSELPTTFKSEDDKYYYYTADTPSFSFFAISQKSIIQLSPGENPNNTIPENTAAGTPGTGSSKNKIYLVIFIFTIIIILVLIVLGINLWKIRKKKKLFFM